MVVECGLEDGGGRCGMMVHSVVEEKVWHDGTQCGGGWCGMIHSVVEDGGIGLLLASHSQLSGGFQTHCFPPFCHPSAIICIIQCTTN